MLFKKTKLNTTIDKTEDISEKLMSEIESQGTPDQDTIGRNGHGEVRLSSFAHMLVEAGGLSAEQVARSQETARLEGAPLARILVRDGLIQSRELAALTALYLGLPMVDLPSQPIDPSAVALVPKDLAKKYTVMPIKIENGSLTVAMADPTDLRLIQDLAARTSHSIDPVVATSEDIQEHIDITYRFSGGLSQEAIRELQIPGSRVTAKLLKESTPTDVIDLLMHQALQDRASDVHIEPTDETLRVRFRIDGILHDVMGLPLEMHPKLLSRVKIISGMNIAERRRPQDGQFSIDYQSRKVDVRAAVSGTVNGEMAVLRVLDKKFTLLGLEELGMSPQGLERFRRVLRSPYGMILVCGPTGSGKTTTLYASILEVNRVERSVISIEDPVEYRVSDVNQMQVNADAKITFASQLRGILRLDPNVILVGEIRDQETATVATQASLTGHLVLSSVHANDAVSALLRLRDLGIAPYLIASSVVAIVAQRMVRVICTRCKVMMPRPLAELQAFASEVGEERKEFVYGSGCNMCAQTGYHGRTGVYEIFTLSDTSRRFFLSEEPRQRVWEQAVKDGMTPLRKDGMQKVKAGITTPYEIMRSLFTQD